MVYKLFDSSTYVNAMLFTSYLVPSFLAVLSDPCVYKLFVAKYYNFGS